MQVQNYRNFNSNYNQSFKAKVEFDGDKTYLTDRLKRILEDMGSRIGTDSDIISFHLEEPKTVGREEYSQRYIYVTTRINGDYVDADKYIGYSYKNESHEELLKKYTLNYMKNLSKSQKVLTGKITCLLEGLNSEQLKFVEYAIKFAREYIAKENGIS